MDSIYQAIGTATPIWQQAVFHLGRWHALVAGAYGVAAWLCFLNARLIKEAWGVDSTWCVAAVLMCLLGANVVLQGDVFVTQTFRALARLQGWYGQRSELQYLAIGFIALAVLGLGVRIFQRIGSGAQTDSDAVSAGLLALLLLLCVRTVSAHGTDVVINVRLAGFSMGRFLELACLGWVIVGALRSLYLPSAAPETRRTGSARHV